MGMAITADRTADEKLFAGIVNKACSGASVSNCPQVFSSAKYQLRDIDCHSLLVQTVFDECLRRATHGSPGGWNGFNMKFSQVLVNMCEGREALGQTQAQLDAIVKGECGTSHAKDSHV